MNEVQTMPGADDSDHNLLVAKTCARLKINHKVPKGIARWDLEKLYTK
jgi:hypothetical protein